MKKFKNILLLIMINYSNHHEIFLNIKQIFFNHLHKYIDKPQLLMPNKPTMGTIASNFVLILKSKSLDENMINEIVKNLTIDLKTYNFVKEIKVINGFFNIYINDYVLINIIKFFSHNKKLLSINEECQATIDPILHFEFGSINPTGPIHLGHLRSIIVAQCLSNLYTQLGITVYKEFFLNDCGNQIQEFMKSIYYRWLQSKGEIINEEIPYKGSYINNLIPKNIPQNISFNEFLSYESTIIEQVKNETVNNLKSMGVIYDQVTYESHLRKNNPLIIETFNQLIKQSMICILNTDEDLLDLHYNYPPSTNLLETTPTNTVILLTKNLNFEKNKVIMKNGILTYFGADILYIYDKINRGFNKQYCFLGEDHIGHLHMLETLVKKLFYRDKIEFIPKKIGFVKVFNEKKEIIPMSKRKGQFLDFNEVKSIIGIDFLKIIMISRTMNNELIFHINKAQEENIKNNYLFYIQYAYARICSVLNKVNDDLLIDYNPYNIQLTTNEQLILKQLLWMNENFNYYAMEQDVHGIFQWTYNLCNYFHSYFYDGCINTELKFIHDNLEIQSFRIDLLKAIKSSLYFVLKNIINIEPLEKM